LNRDDHPADRMAPKLISMNRRQFFQQSAAVAALSAEGMLPSLLEAQSPAAPLPGGAEAGQKRSWRRIDLRRKDSVPDSERSLVFEA
jgi:hypothetical protein